MNNALEIKHEMVLTLVHLGFRCFCVATNGGSLIQTIRSNERAHTWLSSHFLPTIEALEREAQRVQLNP
jgi:hypothetical protein